jgi:hypothetical protein
MGNRTTVYYPDSLNQYTSVSNPQQFDVTGMRANGTNTVAVNGTNLAGGEYQPANTGLYYRKELTHNAGNGIYEQVTVTENGQTIENGKQYVPPANEPLTYDEDGNLTSDGRWTYS